MATIPSPSSQTASAVVTSTLLNNHRDALQFLLGSTMTGGGGRRPFALLRATAVQAIATGAGWASVTYDTEDVDYDASHSTVTNTSRFTAVTAGWHLAVAQAGFAGNATGNRLSRFAVTGTGKVATEQGFSTVPNAGAFNLAPNVMMLNLAVNDYIEHQLQQGSGGNLNTIASASNQPFMFVTWWSN